MAYKYNPYPTAPFCEPSVGLNLELLMDICRIQGKSGDEKDMQLFIVKYLKDKGLYPEIDKKGNIYCVKGTAAYYPTMVAHTDTVHDRYAGYDVAISSDAKLLYAYANAIQETNFPMVSRKHAQVGVGGDDRCGIYVALHLLDTFDNFKVFFPVEEETGGHGSRAADMSFFDDSVLVLQCDRKGHDDWVQTVSGTKVSDKTFTDDIGALLKDHGYKVTQSGGFTDVGVLKQRGLKVAAANMSCGYYDPHMSTEVIHLAALQNTLSLCHQVFLHVGDKPVLHAHSVYKSPSSSGTLYSERNQAYKNENYLNGKYFTPQDYGWKYEYIATAPLKNGYVKTIGDKLVGPYTWAQTLETEKNRIIAENLDKASVDAKTTSEARKALKKWIDDDGTWFYVKRVQEWQKQISDKPGGQLWVVSYANKMTDIPEKEKEFMLDFEGCYGPSVEPGQKKYTAEEISTLVHDVLYSELAKEHDDDDDDIPSSTLLLGMGDESDKPLDGSERASNYVAFDEVADCDVCGKSGILVNDQVWCENCQDFTQPIAGTRTGDQPESLTINEVWTTEWEKENKAKPNWRGLGEGVTD